MARATVPRVLLIAVAVFAALQLLVGRSCTTSTPAPPREQTTLEPRAPLPLEEVEESVEADPPPRRAARPSLHVTGPTPFVRRLAAGGHLLALARELAAEGADRKGIHADLRTLRRFLLFADGRPPKGLEPALQFLTKPRRDRESLHLEAGRTGLLRLWTLEPCIDVRTVERSEAFLEQLIGVAGHRMPRGVDILATPRLGCELFPEQPPLSFAAGVYFPRDRYCLVRSNLHARRREEVIRHELVHAYTLGPLALRGAPRLVSEGLAEYLRFLRPRDPECNVPLAALRDYLAHLERALVQSERMGYDLSGVEPRRIVHLKPWAFYRLPFGYALALAMHAYVGNEPVARTLRARSDAPLIAALEEIDWPEFRAWLQQHAEGGDPRAAHFVRDLVAELPEKHAQNMTAWQAVRLIGASSSRSVRSMRESAVELMGTRERLAEVIRLLRAPDGGPVVIATDLSPAMDTALGAVELPDAWGEENIRSFVTATPRDLVASVHGVLSAGADPAPTLFGFSANTQPRRNVRAVEPFQFERRPDWLEERGANGVRLVVCTAQRGSRRSALHIQRLREMLPTTAVVLVIDLARSRRSDAALIAGILAEGALSLNVAYWRP